MIPSATAKTIRNRLPAVSEPVSGAGETDNEVLSLLDDALNLRGRAFGFSRETPLLGALPELDSMAVVGLLTRLEEHFGFAIDDDELDGAVFATVGTLTSFVQAKLDREG